MKVIAKKVYETSDGYCFTSITGAHNHLDNKYWEILRAVADDINGNTGRHGGIADTLDKRLGHLVVASQIKLDKIVEGTTMPETPEDSELWLAARSQ